MFWVWDFVIPLLLSYLWLKCIVTYNITLSRFFFKDLSVPYDTSDIK